MDVYQQYVFKSRYARYLPEENRRESWEETVGRYINFFKDRGQLNDKEAKELFNAIRDMEVMPSMRALMTAGPALDRDNVAGFNCSYIPIDHQRAFDELMYILLCGTGVGFSVERDYVRKLPEVAEAFYKTDTTVVVADSKIGWAKAFRELISLLYSGQIPSWDVSHVRPAGSPLKTFGGRASGPEPLVNLFEFTVNLFTHAAGRRLSTLECHDLCCKIADIVVVGGVRRSALISLSDLTDDRIRRAKHGQWWYEYPHRALANNSVCYTKKPDFDSFLPEWASLFESRSGERGFFSREASRKQAAKNGRRDDNQEFGTNPCSEIILRPNQFCNLSEVIVRPNDTEATLRKKVRLATILGTLQATLTDFRYLRSKWKHQTEEEALLGVSMTGIQDCNLTNGKMGLPLLQKTLDNLKHEAIRVNKEWAKKLGINQATAITCVKPSGTVSQLVDSSSGIHGRYSKYYIRRIRADHLDPLCNVLVEAGLTPEVDKNNKSALVFSFPQKAPRNAVLSSEQTGLQQLEIWKVYQEYWCEHKPSITVYYRDNDFLAIGDWLYNNFDAVSGVSFLPYSEHTYEQAPYEEIDRATYTEMVKQVPKEVNWDITEEEDVTEGLQTLACTGGACEI